MKRLVVFLLVLILLAGLVPVQASGVTDVMKVINCSEWVSLREDPSTSSRRLAKVYLGELVTNCSASFDGFISCDYDGKSGFILNQYLGMTDFSDDDMILGNQMVVNVSEYANMLDSPYSSGRRLTRVPVGAVVTSCVSSSGNYVYCVYQGVSGYISSSYLKKANYSVTRQDASVVKKYEGLFPEITGPMEVVRCDEWVSLREKASASSARLAKVPLGAQVTGCLQVSDTFVYCCYLGVWGYVQKAYLQANDEPVQPEKTESAFDLLPQRPEYEAFNAVGTLAEEFWSDPMHTYRVIIRKDIRNSAETVCAAVYDSDIQYLCRMNMTDYDVSELSSISVFAGGTEEQRVLLWFSGTNLTAYRIGPQMYDDILWSVDLPKVGGGVSHAVDQDGTIYLIGYYQNQLTCISPEGEVRWQVSNEQNDVYWPSGIKIEGDRVSVVYDESGAYDGTQAIISYSREDGRVIGGDGTPSSEPAVQLTWNKGDENPYYLFTASTESDAVGVLFTPLETLKNFEFLSIDFRDFTDESESFDTEILFSQPELTPETKLLVLLSFYGDIPNNGFAYVDSYGVRHVFAINISGENGDLIAYEINK